MTDRQDEDTRRLVRWLGQGDMGRCIWCKRLRPNGVCGAAAAGQLPGVSYSYMPVPHINRRCEAYDRSDPEVGK